MISRLRSHLREYCPAALAAFHGAGKPVLDSPRARVILTAAPTPADAARLTRSQLRALLKRGERSRRGIKTEIERLRAIFRADYLRQLPQVKRALRHRTVALVRQVDAACLSVTQLAAATEEAFLAHPDADIITSIPGLSVLSGARVLAEIGDRRRAGGERHTAALRHLFNKLLGCLYHCLRNRMPYDVERAFAVPVALAA